MNDVLLVQQPETLDYGVAKPSDEAQTEALVVVLLDELIQVQAETAKRKDSFLIDCGGCLRLVPQSHYWQ